MFIRKKTESGNNLSGWRAIKGGFEMTGSADMINQAVIRLIKERTLLTLADSTYISSLTVLKDFDGTSLVVDRVDNWPDNKKNIRIIFKDHEKLWSHFDVEVKKITDEDIITSFPAYLYRLQRRDYYRLLAPKGSKVTFTFEEKKYEGFFTLDISAGGMLISTTKRPPLNIDDTLENVRIFFPAIENGDELHQDEHVFHVPRGKVIYILKDGDMRFHKIGVAFIINDLLRDEIMMFIRQRELELLRKWM